jgi:hypothetical protein
MNSDKKNERHFTAKQKQHRGKSWSPYHNFHASRCASHIVPLPKRSIDAQWPELLVTYANGHFPLLSAER